MSSCPNASPVRRHTGSASARPLVHFLFVHLCSWSSETCCGSGTAAGPSTRWMVLRVLRVLRSCGVRCVVWRCGSAWRTLRSGSRPRSETDSERPAASSSRPSTEQPDSGKPVCLTAPEGSRTPCGPDYWTHLVRSCLVHYEKKTFIRLRWVFVNTCI